MPVKVANFMGRFGWEMQKRFPTLSANSYLKLQFLTRNGMQKKYIDYFLKDPENPPFPNVVNIETINRCNSNCAFCTANVHAEKRPFKKMEPELYRRIIDGLADWGYRGHLTLYGNNEPWLDDRIVEFHKYAREKLPDCFIFMSTNGLLLTVDRMKSVVPYVNQLIINNYCEDMKLHKTTADCLRYIRENPDEFRDVDVLIQMRYVKAVLTNRAGSAPNKQAKTKIVRETCLMPYTDMWITPDGRLGYCCCDNFEVTELADVNKVPVKEAWNSEAYRKFRESVRNGRAGNDFCKYCDFIDGGLRMDIVAGILKGQSTTAEASQKLFH
ncbi:MAG: radical SAM protein [Lachnospiraceae bacterium]|jgi:organic radical activating enzyme|nr:radical SAM protein [Lachnospiraceae bacterium]